MEGSRPGAVVARAEPGFLRALHALGRAAGAIHETDEATRITEFLADCDPAAAGNLS